MLPIIKEGENAAESKTVMARKTSRRTRKGNVTSSARKRYGARGGKLKRGSFPVFDRKSAMSAIRLRGHSRSKKAVLDKVSAWANRHNDASVKAAVKRARAKDR